MAQHKSIELERRRPMDSWRKVKATKSQFLRVVNALYQIRSIIDWCGGTFSSFLHRRMYYLALEACMHFAVSNLNSAASNYFSLCLSGTASNERSTHNSSYTSEARQEVHSRKLLCLAAVIMKLSFELITKKGVIISERQRDCKTKRDLHVLTSTKYVKWSVTSDFRRRCECVSWIINCGLSF